MKQINVKGAIVPSDEKWIYNMFEMDATCPKDISNVLSDLTDEPVELIINSGGGDVFSASEIYTELRSYKGEVNARIVGVAASAATVISSACSKVTMSPTASYMIHKASTIGIGNSDDFQHASDFLDTVDKSIVTAYMDKTGMAQEDLLQMMKDETWLSASDAKEKGFVDEIMFSEQAKAVASATGALPQNVIDTMRQQKQQPQSITIEDIKSVVAEMKEEILSEIKEETKSKPTNNSWLF